MSRARLTLALRILVAGLLCQAAFAASASSAESSRQAAVAAAAPTAPGVAGKVVIDRKPAAEVWVHAYTDAGGAFRGEGLAHAPRTAEDGAFSLSLPPGTYYLVAKGHPDASPASEPGAGDFFGYYGGNPVTVTAGATTTCIIQVVRRRPPVVAPDKQRDMMTVTGLVLGPDGPVEAAAVHVYTDASQQFRGPDMFGPQGAVAGGTDARGAFSIELPAGTYYLVGSKRKGGAMLGHLQLGDLHGYYDGNPLRVAPETSTSVVIQVGERVRNTLGPGLGAAGATGIRGKIRDPSGAVPAGVYAFVTTDPSPMIGAMPSYRSSFLGPDGSYAIELPAGTTYYVFARSGYGGPPVSGEWNGFYGDDSAHPVVVRSGSITDGIDFVVKKAP